MIFQLQKLKVTLFEFDNFKTIIFLFLKIQKLAENHKCFSLGFFFLPLKWFVFKMYFSYLFLPSVGHSNFQLVTFRKWIFIKLWLIIKTLFLPNMDKTIFHRTCEHWTRWHPHPGRWWWGRPGPAWTRAWPRTRPLPRTWCHPMGSGGLRTCLQILGSNSNRIQIAN